MSLREFLQVYETRYIASGAFGTLALTVRSVDVAFCGWHSTCIHLCQQAGTLVCGIMHGWLACTAAAQPELCIFAFMLTCDHQ